jgi:hypothetical protein
MENGSMSGFLRGLLAIVAILLPMGSVAQEAWTVQMTSRQAKALAELAQHDDFTAFAISPDGAWGRAWGVNTAENAAARAMNYCQAELRPGKRDCILYAVAGRRIMPEIVQTRKVSKVYKPLNGRVAAEVFGRVAFDFQGDSAVAQAQYNSGPKRRGDLPEDAVLRAILLNRSLMSVKSKGFATTFEADIAEQSAQGQSGMLKAVFSSWAVTSDGLVCMFDGYWSTGKPIGTRCLILNSAAKGAVDMSWAFRPLTSQKMQLIAGDARFATAK